MPVLTFLIAFFFCLFKVPISEVPFFWSLKCFFFAGKGRGRKKVKN